jgi:hypothetical protein
MVVGIVVRRMMVVVRKKIGWVCLLVGLALVSTAWPFSGELHTVQKIRAQSYAVIVDPLQLTISEPDGSGTVLFTLTSQPTAKVSFDLATSNNQCAVSPGTIELNETNWDTGITAAVTAVDDGDIDGTQTCVVGTGITRSGDGNFRGLDPDDVTVLVEDDDEAGIVVEPTTLTVSEPDGTATFTVTLTSQPTADVTIDLSTSNNECTAAPDPVILTSSNWSGGVQVTVSAVDDEVDDGTQTCTVQTAASTSSDPLYDDVDPEDVTVSVEDDGDTAGITVDPPALTISEPDGSDSFAIRLDSQPTNAVYIPLSRSNTECSISESYAYLTTANWSTGVEITVTAVDDEMDDGTQICTVVTGQAQSEDPNYLIDPGDVAVSVQDDDGAGILVSPLTLAISEPAGSAPFTIRLGSQPTADVTIDLSTSNNQCTASPDPVILTSSNWSGGVQVTVSAVDDDVDDGTQTCVVQTASSTSSDSVYNDIDPADVTVTVGDDDEPGIVVEPTSLTVSEPSGTAHFTIRLASEPASSVSVPLGASNTQCAVSPSPVALTAANWSGGVQATVIAVDDGVADGTQTCLIQVGPTTSADPNYDARSPGGVTVTVLDRAVYVVYLPAAVRGWPPVPRAPVLDPIGNADGDGTYPIGWSAVPDVDSYMLQQATQSSFANAVEIYAGTARSHTVTGRGPGRYYYRVRARNEWGDGKWSTAQWVDVLWEAEPNDQALTQANGPLVSGLTYYGVFLDGSDVQDYFYVDLPAAHTVEMWLTNIAGGQDYNLVLRDTSLQAVGYSAQAGNTDEHIKTGVVPAGRYYIQVYHYSSGGSTRAYHLRIVHE